MISCRVALSSEDRRACYRLRSEMYRRHYGNIPQGGFSDPYDTSVLKDGRPQSLLILAEDDGRPAGTLRSTVAWDSDDPGVRSGATALFDLAIDQPGALEALVGHIGAPLARVVELNKMSVLPVENHRDVLRATFALAARLATEAGIPYTIGVMTPVVARSLRMAGMHYRRVPSARLRRETPRQVRYLVKHHEYFLPSLARSCPRAADSGFSEATPIDELVAAIAPCADGAHLYWLSTEELRGATRPRAPTRARTEPAG